VRTQRGLSLIGAAVVGFLILLCVIVATKVTPVLLEYWTIQKTINAIVKGGEARGATVSDIRKSFDRRATIDDIRSITGADLDITKESGEVVIGFSYSRKIPLFANASLCLDLEGATSPTALREP
jgi:hypothetical protein